MCEDPKFSTNPERVRNITELTQIISVTLAEKTTRDWLDIFQELDIPSGRINNIADLFNDPQVLAREMIVDVPQKGFNVKMPGVPIKFSATPAGIGGPAPSLGEHNGEIYMKLLGLSFEELEEFKNRGVI